jgi:hypothetical protein
MVHSGNDKVRFNPCIKNIDPYKSLLSHIVESRIALEYS